MTIEEIVIDALDKSTPATILHSERLRSYFKLFLERGTQVECQQLFSLNTESNIRRESNTPASYEQNRTTRGRKLHPKPSRCSHHDPDSSLPIPSAPSLTAQLPSNRSRLPKSSASSKIQSQPRGSAAEVLRQLNASTCEWSISEYHKKSLFNATVAYVSTTVSPKELKSLWDLDGAIFERGQAKTRFSRLYHGQQRVQERSNTLAFLSRSVSVLLRHDIDHKAATVEKSSLSKGRGRLSIALEQLAQEIPTTKVKLSGDYTRSTMFYKLIEKCGPGDLATLGADSNHIWQKDLSSRDVDFLISFRSKHFPKAEEAARELDFPVASLMIEALVTCGWKYDELAKGNTRFLRQLRRFVDADSLAKGHVAKAKSVTAITLNVRSLNTISPADNPELDIRTLVSGTEDGANLNMENEPCPASGMGGLRVHHSGSISSDQLSGSRINSDFTHESVRPRPYQEGDLSVTLVDKGQQSSFPEHKCRKRPHSEVYSNSKRIRREATLELSQNTGTSYGQSADDNSLQNGTPSAQTLLNRHQIDITNSSTTQDLEAGQFDQVSCYPFAQPATPAVASSTTSSPPTSWSVSSSSSPSSLENRSQERHITTSEPPLQANVKTPKPSNIDVQQKAIPDGMRSQFAVQLGQKSQPLFNVERFSAAGQSLGKEDQDVGRAPQSHHSHSLLLEGLSLEQRVPSSMVEEGGAGLHMSFSSGTDSRRSLSEDLLDRNGSDTELNRNPNKSVDHVTGDPASSLFSSSMSCWGNWNQSYQLTMPEPPVQAGVPAPERFYWNNRGQDTEGESRPAGTGMNPAFFWGNWDQDYEDGPGREHIGAAPAFYLGNWDQDYDNTPTFSWGNWDQDYEDASREAETGAAPAFFWGNWDQDYDAALAGTLCGMSRASYHGKISCSTPETQKRNPTSK